ncbi:MAG: hypothetical protein ACRC8A_09785 [Microcoleaceae cyanobacterium]
MTSIICGIWAFTKAFQTDYVIQDDARSHVVWMLRFVDPELFPRDFIINYFQSVAPLGYRTLYQGLELFGIHPFLANKLLPTILGLISTGYCFGVCWQIFPVPMAGFLATFLLNQNLWLKDDLITATPRAFFYPLFLAFLYYLLRQSWRGVGLTITLLGLFYPQGVLLGMAVLSLQVFKVCFRNKTSLYLKEFSKIKVANLFRTRFPITTVNRSQLKPLFWTLLVGLGAGSLVLLPYSLNSSEFGSVITLAEAKNLPEFYPGGRAAFFTDKPWDFWLTGDRSGLLPQEWFLKSVPLQVCAGLLLPILLQYPTQFPLIKNVTGKIVLLPEVILCSIGLFFLAHAFLFKLHHPSRYSHHSLRIIAAISGGIAITILLNFLYRKLHWKTTNFPVKFILSLVLFLLLCYPALLNHFPTTNYVVGRFPLLYEFFARQPKETLIASISTEANNLPAFSQRSILVGSEYALPYHQKYYREIQQRAQALIAAQYSSNLETVQQFIKTYNVNFWLLESKTFTPEYLNKSDFLQKFSPEVIPQVEKNLIQGVQPILATLTDSCTILQVENLIVLDTNCILNVQF